MFPTTGLWTQAFLPPCAPTYPEAAPFFVPLQPLPCFRQCPGLPEPFTIIGTELEGEQYSDADERITLHSQWAPEWLSP